MHKPKIDEGVKADWRFLLTSTYFVEKHLVIREPSYEVSQAVEENQGLQGDLTETSDQTQPQLEIKIMMIVEVDADKIQLSNIKTAIMSHIFSLNNSTKCCSNW